MAPTHDHIVKSFDSELQRLHGEIQRMGEIAISQLDAAVDVLKRRDSDAARRVVANDDAIDALEHEVSHDVLRLLALRQPMARDEMGGSCINHHIHPVVAVACAVGRECGGGSVLVEAI